VSVIRVGSTNKYAEGWDSIFGGGKKPAAAKAKAAKASRVVKKKAVTKARKPGKSRRG
jgi:hypothetical protein